MSYQTSKGKNKERIAVNLKHTKVPQIYMMNKSNFDYKKYKLLTEQDRPRVRRKATQLIQEA